MSLGAPTVATSPLAPLRYLDVALVVLAAPIAVLTGVSGAGYGIGAGAWLALRAAGAAVDRAAGAAAEPRTQISLRMGYMLGRLFLLALAVILARSSAGRDGGLAALVLIVAAFTVALGTSALNRPRSR